MLTDYFNKEKYPNVYSGHNYALEVVSGKIPSSIYVVGACKRYFKDLEKGFYIFDKDKAERYLKLTQRFQHVKGKNWKTSNVTYEPWQNFMLMNIMGWVDPRTNERRFRISHVEIPRGQGKSLVASQMALYFLALDNPRGNEISTAGVKVEQARIVLDSARAMAKGSPDYLKATGVEVLAHKIVHTKSNSFVRALSSDDKSLDGLNDVLCVIDELHAVSKDLFDVIYSGLSKRSDSLLLCISTSGFNLEGVGYSQSVYAKKVATGEVQDDQLFSIIYTIDEGDDIFDPISWKKANPNWGVSVDPITFEAKANKAKITPSDVTNFKTKHLNLWCGEAKSFFSTEAWDKCADTSLRFEDFYGHKCYVGIDLASKIDLSSFVYVFRKDGTYYIFDKTFIPEVTVTQARSPLYENCIGTGHLIATPGEAIHYPKLKDDFLTTAKNVKIINALYDPWNATSFAQDCQNERIEMVEFRMNTANLSEPTKNLDALIRQGKVRHNGSPLLRYCLGNIVAKEDAAGNVFPKKTNEKLKIDPIIALIMAIASWMNEKEETSNYATRGIRFV